MKRNCIFPCLMIIALITGCIKEEGESYSVSRTVSDSAIYTAEKGYLYGESTTPVCTAKDYKVVSVNKIMKLYCTLTMQGSFYNMDQSKDSTIKACGFVASQNNSLCFINCDDTEKHITLSAGNGFESNWSSAENFDFTATIPELEHKKDYYVRSFVITDRGDTAYSHTSVKVQTAKPRDIWFEREKATLSAREKAFKFQHGEYEYVYGGRGAIKCYNDMWRYNHNTEEWTQVGSGTDVSTPTGTAPSEKCNGAALVIPRSSLTGTDKVSNGDTLIYFTGGEDEDENPLNSTIWYSIKNQRFCATADLPNNRNYVGELPLPLKGCVGFYLETSGMRYFYVGLGTNSVNAPSPEIYNYYPEGDKIILTITYLRNYDNTGDSLDLEGNRIVEKTTTKYDIAWNQAANLTNNKVGEGLSDPICVQVTDQKVVVGTGVGSTTGKPTGKPTRRFYPITSGTLYDATVGTPFEGPTDMTPRTAATGFYLHFTDEEGNENSKLYVGTGIDENGNYLNDFWCYDFISSTWAKISDCGYRETTGKVFRAYATSFSIERQDELYSIDQRGIVCLGRGYNETGSSSQTSLFQDMWEYLP